MNPWFKGNTLGAVVCGFVLAGLLLLVMYRTRVDFQFYAFLNLINLFNPVSWIMGLVWYIPLFFYLYPSVSKLGRALLLLPLFVPPGLDSNAVLAYAIAVIFALASRLPSWENRLYRPMLNDTLALTQMPVSFTPTR